MRKNLSIPFVFLIVLLAAALPAQAWDNGIDSPYSRYGFGRLSGRTTGFNSGMAGVGFALQSGNEVNPLNPASYAGIDTLSLVFDVGGSLQLGRYKEGSARAKSTTASLDYVTAGFLVGKGLGVSLGLMPFSKMGYSIASNDVVADGYAGGNSVTASNIYSGEGGLHEVFLGAGWSPVRYMALGVNFGYLWGSLNHGAVVTYNDANVVSSYRRYESSIHNYNISVGLQGYIPVSKSDRLSLGATYTLGHKVNNNSMMVLMGDSTWCRNAFQLPHKLGVGLAWSHRNNIRLAADYEYQRWSDCQFPWLTVGAGRAEDYAPTKGMFRDSHRAALGIEYCPIRKGAHWREFVKYRAGVSLTTPYANVARQTAAGTTDWQRGPLSILVTAGVNLPVMNMFNGRSSVNLSVQYERVQPSATMHLAENYFRLCVGVNFDEQWFAKWKVK